MSREIKFRAWSKKDKRLVYLAESITSNIHLQMNNHSWGIFEPDRENYCGGATLNNHFGDILMQYTGLKDKNGKEIYEGDIVKDECGLYGNVVYSSEQYDGIAGFMVFDVYDGLQNRDGFWHLCEVIGNIYENPELLESEVE